MLIFFNRPSKLRALWDVIENIKPAVVIAVSDGPKSSADVELVRQCREIVRPNWPCKLVELYREENLGCRNNVITGLSTVFQNFPEAIVLEDDCIPHPSFFSFCRDMLRLYASSTKIFSITGLNQFEGRYGWTADAGYGFSRYFCSWGWAAWSRSWELCSWEKMPSWDEVQGELAQSLLIGDTEPFWKRLLVDEHTMWDYQTTIAALRHRQLTIFPRHNAIKNIGLDTGVHFGHLQHKFLKWKLPAPKEIGSQIIQPAEILPDDAYDSLFEKRHHEPNRFRRVLRRLWDSEIVQGLSDNSR